MAENFLAQFLRSMGVDPETYVMPEFKPCMFVIPGLDILLYVEKDCSWREKWLPGSNISLLLDPHDNDVIVGVKIANFSAAAPSSVKEQFGMPKRLPSVPGSIDPMRAHKALEEYFANVSVQQFYDDVVKASPELAKDLGLRNPREKSKRDNQL